MADVVSRQKRSEMMSGIKGKNTKPEHFIRKALHARGYRFRLHKKGLPGKPDLVLPKYNAAIFVHGCFWHGHDCHLFKWPQSRPEFWRTKIKKNRENDEKTLSSLHKQDWRVLVVWECAIKGKERLGAERIIDGIVGWLHSDESYDEIRGSGGGSRAGGKKRLQRNKRPRPAKGDDGR